MHPKLSEKHMEGCCLTNHSFENENVPGKMSEPSSSFMQRLPDEILGRILQEVLPPLQQLKSSFDKLDDPLQSNEIISDATSGYMTHPHYIRIMLSIVCWRWRNLILENRAIWSIYQLDHSLIKFKSEWLERWISLAKGHPLEVLIIPRKWLIPDPQPFYRILRRHRQQLRIYAAEFIRPRAPLSLGIFPKQPRTSIVELPYLEEFILHTGDIQLPIRISAPKLRILCTGLAFGLFTDESFKNLSEWTIATGSSRSSIDISSVNRRLAICHYLTSLRVDSTGFWMGVPPGTVLQSLQELRLIGQFNIPTIIHFSTFMPNIEILVIVNETRSTISPWLCQLLKGLGKLHRLTLENFVLEEDLWNLTSAHLGGLELRNCKLGEHLYQALAQCRGNLQLLALDNCEFSLHGLLNVLQGFSVHGCVLSVSIRHNRDILRKCKDLTRFQSVFLHESSFKPVVERNDEYAHYTAVIPPLY